MCRIGKPRRSVTERGRPAMLTEMLDAMTK
jgi:hypothetical protein